MTTARTKSAVAPRRDRWADWAVVALVAVALLLGWLLRGVILYRTEPFTFTNAGISGALPSGWSQQLGENPLTRARDVRGGSFDTVLELRSRPLSNDAEMTLVLDALALERAGEAQAYQTLSTDEVLVDGAVAVQRSFVYVVVNRNPYTDHLPVVVRGVDVALRGDGRVVVGTFLAEQDAFDAHYRHFRDFIKSLEY